VQIVRRYFEPIWVVSFRRPLFQIVLLFLSTSVLLTPSVLATPAEEISRAVAVDGVTDLSVAPPKQFLRAFTATAIRAQPRELPNYVVAAVQFRPELAPNITAIAIKAAIKNAEAKPGILCVLIDRIIRAAIAGNPEAVVVIAKAGASASSELRQCVLAAAISAAPSSKDAIVQAINARALPFAFLTFSAAAHSGFSFTAPTLNPANIADHGSGSVVSPEQPPGE
jgi:hypothetical protein